MSSPNQYKIQILKKHDRVIIDGEPYTVDCSDLPSEFKSLHWREVDGGWIEWNDPHMKVGSITIPISNSDISEYQRYIDAWHTAKANASPDEVRRAEQIKIDTIRWHQNIYNQVYAKLSDALQDPEP